MTRWIAAGVLVLAVAACQPIVATPSGVTSKATWVVEPATVGGRTGIEVRMRACNEIEIWVPGSGGGPIRVDTKPVVVVTDARGVELFDIAPWHNDHTVPAGSSVSDGGKDGAHVVRVPTAAGRAPLTIKGYCSAYVAGEGRIFDPVWAFPACTTTRTCKATQPGQGSFGS